MGPELPENPDDAALRALLGRTRRIAVVGLSPKAHRDSHRVSAYMQRAGCEIVPVYPREETILGARVHRAVAEIEGAVDMVNVFRRAEEIPEVAEDILAAAAAKTAVVWLQYDCVHEGAIRRMAEAGHTVVYDRCLMVEHARLFR